MLDKYYVVRNTFLNEEGQVCCPFCKKEIKPNTEFRDALSQREFRTSGLCQKCQDDMWPPEEVVNA